MKTMIKFVAAATLAAGLAAGLSSPSAAQTADTALGATIGALGAGAAWGGPDVPFRPPYVGSYSDIGNGALGFASAGGYNGYGYGYARPRYRYGYVRPGYGYGAYGAYGNYGGYGAYGAYGSALGAYGAAQDTWTGGDFNTGCETSGAMYGQLNDYSACAGD